MSWARTIISLYQPVNVETLKDRLRLSALGTQFIHCNIKNKIGAWLQQNDSDLLGQVPVQTAQ